MNQNIYRGINFIKVYLNFRKIKMSGLKGLKIKIIKTVIRALRN